jgi:dihydropteroate synthase-like protein
VAPIQNHDISVKKAPVFVAAFLTEKMTREILKSSEYSPYDLILIPGFVQWNTGNLEGEFNVKVKKGPEFASDLPLILDNLELIELSHSTPANKLFKNEGEKAYRDLVKKQIKNAQNNLCHHTFFINEKISPIIIGRNVPPPIIAEVVNCTEKSEKSILRKVKHYIDSGADIIDIGCVSNKPNPEKVKEIIQLIRNNYEILISVDSMDPSEIFAAVDTNIDLILSFDLGNYTHFLEIPKDIPIVILPTNIKRGYFPKDPETRVENLFKLTEELRKHGFKKLIADPLLETPISPGICNSLNSFFQYKKMVSNEKYRHLELPLFFGISNVVEMMDIDSVGINGLLASIAIELDIGVVFTVEHSPKLMNGVAELKECVKLNYLSKSRKTPPINQGIQVFKSKGKTNGLEIPTMAKKDPLRIAEFDPSYTPDEKGYFKFYVNQYNKEIYVLFFSNKGKLLQSLIGNNAEALSKKIIELELTSNISHINYVGRELNKAEFCVNTGKPYTQDN